MASDQVRALRRAEEEGGAGRSSEVTPLASSGPQKAGDSPPPPQARAALRFAGGFPTALSSSWGACQGH